MCMKKIVFLLCCISAILPTSCHQDKGNYDFPGINTMSVAGLERSYKVLLREVITPIPTPVLAFKYGRPEDLSYEWRVNHQIVSEHATLDEPIAIPIGNYPASLTVIDNKTSFKYFHDFEVEVISPYSYGLSVLSELPDGKSTLSFQTRNGSTIVEVWRQNVFESENPTWGNLGTDPVSHYYTVMDQCYYLLSGGGEHKIVRLEPNGMTFLGAINARIAANYDGEFRPSHMITVPRGNYTRYGSLIVADGELFTYNYENSKILTYVEKPAGVEYNYQWAGFSRFGPSGVQAIPLYDAKTNQFLSAKQNGLYFSYQEIHPYDEDPAYTGTSVDLGDLEYVTAELMVDDGYTGGSWSYVGYQYSSTVRFLFRDAGNTAYFYTYDYETEMDYSTYKYVPWANYGVTLDKTVAGLLTAESVAKAAIESNYWFIGTGRTLSRHFWTDPSTPIQVELPATVKGKITALFVNTSETTLFVGVYDDSSPENLKGGIAVFNIRPGSSEHAMFELLEYYPNVCGKAKSIVLKE